MEDHERIAEVYKQCVVLKQAKREKLLARLETLEPEVAGRVRELLGADSGGDHTRSLTWSGGRRWPRALQRLTGWRGPWFWALLAADCIALGFYVFFFLTVARYGISDPNYGGVTRMAVYFAVSVAFTSTAAWIGFLKPEDRTARLGCVALMAEGLCLLSSLLNRSEGQFRGTTRVVFELLFLFDGLNFPLAYHFYWSYFDSHLKETRGRKALYLVYGWAVLSLALRLFSETEAGGRIFSEGFLTIWGHIFYIGFPFAICGMVVANYRKLRLEPAALRRSRWFILCSLAGILAYGVSRLLRVGLEVLGLERLNATPSYHQIELLVVLSILLIPAAAAYAIFRYRMFEIAIRKSVLRNGVLEIAIALPALAVARSLYNDKQRTVAEAIWNNASIIALLVVFVVLWALRPAARRWLDSMDPQTATAFCVCPLCLRCYEAGDKKCAQDESALVRVPIPLVLDGRYRLEQRIGAGGMGAVYRAVDRQLDRTVAVKIIQPGLVDMHSPVNRAEREARAGARLNHPHIATTYDSGVLDSGVVYIVMEFIDGKTMGAALKDGPVTLDAAAEWFDQILQAVDAAHSAGVVHRDLKPDNVLLARTAGGNFRVKIVDFGIAKLRARAMTASASLTRTGAILGTPIYMSPEQRNGGSVDGRTDVYSVGVMLFETLTGRLPFAGSTPSETLIAALGNDLSLDSAAHLGQPVVAAIRKSLARDPGDRFQTAAAFRAEILPLLLNNGQQGRAYRA